MIFEIYRASALYDDALDVNNHPQPHPDARSVPLVCNPEVRRWTIRVDTVQAIVAMAIVLGHAVSIDAPACDCGECPPMLVIEDEDDDDEDDEEDDKDDA